MRANELIDRLGGTVRTAEIFGISPQRVSNWRRRGVPARLWDKARFEAHKRGFVYEPEENGGNGNSPSNGERLSLSRR